MRSIHFVLSLVCLCLTLAYCGKTSSPYPPAAASSPALTAARTAATSVRAVDFVPQQAATWSIWVPDIAAASQGVADFLQQFEEPGDRTRLHTFSKWYGIDMNALADASMVDQPTGLAVFGGNDMAPVAIMRVIDVAKADTFLVQDGDSGARKRLQEQVHGFNRSSWRNRNWAFAGNNLLLSFGISGRVALDRALGHMQAGVTAPSHALTHKTSYISLERQLHPSQMQWWMGGDHEQMGSLSMSAKGFDIHHVLPLGADCKPDAQVSLPTLTHRLDPNALLSFASRLRCTQSQLAKTAFWRDKLTAFAALTGIDPMADLLPLVGATTWEMDWAADKAFSLDNLKMVVTLDVTDAARMQKLLETAEKKLTAADVGFTRGSHRFGTQSVATYAANCRVGAMRHPWLPAPKSFDTNMRIGWAFAGQTLVVTVGSGALEQQSWLWQAGDAPQVATAQALDGNITAATSAGVLRLGRLGRTMYKAASPDKALGATALIKRAARILERLDRWDSTVRHEGQNLVADWTCRLSNDVDAPEAVPQTDNITAGASEKAQADLPGAAQPRREPVLVKLSDTQAFFDEQKAREWPCEQEPKLRAQKSEHPITMLFVNRASVEMTLVRLDNQGKRVEVGSVQPGQILAEETFATHPWLVLGHDDGVCHSIVVPTPMASSISSTGLGRVPSDVTLPKRIPQVQHAAWRHTPSGRGASFVSGVGYSQQEFISNSQYLTLCRKACWNNPACLGFFEQTHACPDPSANDLKSNPNRVPGQGCYRICGFYDKGDHPLTGGLTSGPEGSVWLKADALPKSHKQPDYAGAYAREVAAP